MKYKRLLCGITAAVVSASALSAFVSANDDVADALTTVSASEPKSEQNIEISGEFVSGDFKYEVIGEDKDAVRITGYIGKGGDVVIPNEIDGKPVTVLSTLSNMVWNNGKREYPGENITSVTIPENITKINYQSDLFIVLPNLKSIKVDKNNKNYSSDEQGVLYNKDKTHLICCPLALTNLTIPESVIEIGTIASEEALEEFGYGVYNRDLLNLRELQSIKVDEKNKNFSVDEQGVLYNKDKTQLIVCPNTPTTVTIPASVTSMYFMNEKFSFEKDSELVSINVDPKNKKYFSVDGVLYGKATEDSEYHKNGDVYLAMYPPEKKDAVYKIPETVNDCNNYINNSYITSIEIHANCKYSSSNINGLNCPNLASFSVTEGNPHVYAEDGALFQKDYFEDDWYSGDFYKEYRGKPALISLPSKKTGEYTVPKGVVLIGAFRGGGTLDTTFPVGFVFGNVYRNLNITSLILPQDLTTFRSDFIQSSPKLKSVTIPKGIEKFYDRTFDDCTALSEINYGGTMAEWKEFTSTDEEHDAVWNGTVRYGDYPNYKYFSPAIHCTDGDIPANGDAPAPEYKPTEPTPPEETKTYKPSISADGADEDTKNVLGGITATDYNGAFDEDVFMSATAGKKTDYSLSFDITFTRDGEKVQPKTSTYVTVKVPVPEFLKNCTNIWVYHVNDKGEKENVHATVKDGYIIFDASRFSEYILSSKPLDEPANDPASSTPSADETTSDAPSNSTPSKTDPGATDTNSSPETNDIDTSVETPNKGNPNTGIALAIAPVVLAAAAVVVLKKKR